METSARDGNTKPPDLPLEKSEKYAGEEAIVRTRHGTTDWFKNRKRNTSRLYIVTLPI